MTQALLPILLLGFQASTLGVGSHTPQASKPPKQTSSTTQKAKPKESERVLFRKDAVYVVWDSRGLSIRNGEKKHSTRLPDVSLTPKLFSREEILQTKDLISKGVRTKYATSLAGAKRLGDDIYLLPRWQEKDGSTWLEALIHINLRDLDPHEELVGKFEGFSGATKPLDDRLFFMGEKPSVLGRKADGTYGLASYDPASSKFSYKEMGRNLVSSWQVGATTFLCQERTTYGSRMLASVDVASGSRNELVETRGSISLLDYEKPYLVRMTKTQGEALHNLDTGAEVLLPKSPVIKRTKYGIQVMTKDDPTSVAYYSVDRLEKVAGPPPTTTPTTGGTTGGDTKKGG